MTAFLHNFRYFLHAQNGFVCLDARKTSLSLSLNVNYVILSFFLYLRLSKFPFFHPLHSFFFFSSNIPDCYFFFTFSSHCLRTYSCASYSLHEPPTPTPSRSQNHNTTEPFRVNRIKAISDFSNESLKRKLATGARQLSLFHPIFSFPSAPFNTFPSSSHTPL